MIVGQIMNNKFPKGTYKPEEHLKPFWFKSGKEHPYFGKKRPEHSAKLKGKKLGRRKKTILLIKKCSYCGKDVETVGERKNYKNIFCNRKCYVLGARGIKSPNWRGGITDLYELIRKSEQSKEWKKKVFARDNYTCQECGSKKEIEVHHIKEFSLIFREFLQLYNQFSPIEDKETLLRLALTYELFWDIDNGETLCYKCHNQIKHSNQYVIKIGDKYEQFPH